MHPSHFVIFATLCLLAIFSVSIQPSSASLTDGKSYTLRNVATNSYLRVATERPKIREEWSAMYQVVTTSTLDRQDKGFIWKFAKGFHKDKPDRGFLRSEEKRNEVSQFLPERSAYPVLNDLEMKIVNSNSRDRKVVSFSDTANGPRCLTANGDGQQISWSPCESIDRQEWHFTEL